MRGTLTIQRNSKYIINKHYSNFFVENTFCEQKQVFAGYA